MKPYIWMLLPCLFFFSCNSTGPEAPLIPPPDSGTLIPTDEEDKDVNARIRWFEQMHRSAPDTNWRMIERATALRKRAEENELESRNDCVEKAIDYIPISGVWKERGSRNQAGNIENIAYSPIHDQIWALSGGGSIWKRSRLENDWEVINQRERFDPDFFEIINLEEKERLLAFSGNWLHYSDDQGQTWIGTNENKSVQSYSGFHGRPIKSNGPQQYIIFISKPSYYSDVQLFVSKNKGNNLQSIGRVIEDYNFDHFELVASPVDDRVWFLQKSRDNKLLVHEIDFDNNTFRLLNPDTEMDAGDEYLDAEVAIIDGQTYLYTFIHDKEKQITQLYRSSDFGKSWESLSQLPTLPWKSTFYISPSQPKQIFIGDVNAYKSSDGGASWDIINWWWTYYDNPLNNLHADIMHVKEYLTTEGTILNLISHHGGINISYDYFKSQENIGLDKLYVSQYYSVRTSPINPDLIYAGSQDQGLQATIDEHPDSILFFDQVIAGDYGHLTFTNSGKSLWAAYPDGWIFHFNNAENATATASYQLQSEDETIWLSPIHASPNPQENIIYMAGGNPDGGPGSYLIKLSYDKDEIKAEVGNFNFLEEAIDGTISAIGLSQENPNYWYVATSNGRFFYSHDGGENWTQTLNFIPQGNYLYGQAIEISPSNPKRLYLAGSGYSNPAVYVSDDGGESFLNIHNNLPPTLVYDLALSPDEKFLFAATEAGPYVFDLEENNWMDLSNRCIPNQTYWSVEYVAAHHIVRFGTYGRGIWDFQLEQKGVSTSVTSNIDFEKSILQVFPNPTKGLLNLEHNLDLLQVQIFSTSGNLHRQITLKKGLSQLDLSSLNQGIYFLKYVYQGQGYTKKLILL